MAEFPYVAEFVYALCALTSLGCMILLWRAYNQTHTPLLFWSGICFLMFTLTNILLFVDLVVAPGIDLSALRTSSALAGVILLLYSLIRDNT